jgi:predicted membrane channel-forming protein YqfA (hemolysin III family)
MFVLMGLSAVFPVFHGLELYGFKDMQDRIGLVWMLLQGLLYILGAGLYAVSFPSSYPNIQLLMSIGSLARTYLARFLRHLG